MKHYPVHYLPVSTGETLAYRKAGEAGPHLVLVHGNMSSSVHWQTTMERLEDSYQIHALDLRGFGDSTYHQELNSLYDFGEDVAAFITELKLEDVLILGWSTGGGIVLETARLLPEVIKQVVLLDSVGLQGFPMYKKTADFQMDFSQPISTKEEIAVDPVQVLPILNAYAQKDKNLLKVVWDATIYNLKQPSEEDYELYLDAMLKQRNLVDVDYSLVHFNMTNEANIYGEGADTLKQVVAPILILHGQKDLIVPVAEAHKAKEYLGDQATLIIFEEAGHSVVTDDLDLFEKTLRDHLLA